MCIFYFESVNCCPPSYPNIRDFIPFVARGDNGSQKEKDLREELSNTPLSDLVRFDSVPSERFTSSVYNFKLFRFY